VVNSNNAINSFPTLQIPLGIVAFLEKIYAGEPILTVCSNIGEDVQYRCFKQVYDVKRVSQSDTLLLANYRNRVRGAVLEASHRMGPALICLKISA
jgi:hypothetical protein